MKGACRDHTWNKKIENNWNFSKYSMMGWSETDLFIDISTNNHFYSTIFFHILAYRATCIYSVNIYWNFIFFKKQCSNNPVEVGKNWTRNSWSKENPNIVYFGCEWCGGGWWRRAIAVAVAVGHSGYCGGGWRRWAIAVAVAVGHCGCCGGGP